ncbi:Acyl-coenzyme A amino acid N-acyltransferase 2 [Vulpes lagopus]
MPRGVMSPPTPKWSYGPFPGLIDMFGDGGLNESRASLLACGGFATLALPFFGYEDLPPIMKDLNLDYFEEAAKFVQSRPKGLKQEQVYPKP